MGKLVLVLAVCVLAFPTLGEADQGKALFEAQKCGICHKPDRGKANPSLQEIARAYQGREALLLTYLKGEAEPILDLGKAAMMKKPLEKTAGLSDEERQAMADFMLGHRTP